LATSGGIWLEAGTSVLALLLTLASSACGVAPALSVLSSDFCAVLLSVWRRDEWRRCLPGLTVSAC
jgi:hypothetical protein